MKKQLITLAALSLMTAAAANAQAVTTLPEGGTVQYYERVANYTNGYSGSYYGADLCGYRSELVTYDNGDVYFRYPISRYIAGGGAYIKGHVDGNVMEFAFPQLLNTEDGVQYYVYRLKQSGSTWRYQIDDNQVINFTKDANGVWTMDMEGTVKPDSEYPGFMWGLYNASTGWDGYGEWNINLYPMNEVYNEVPDGVEIETSGWVMNLKNRGLMKVYVAIDGNDIYLGGFSKYVDGFIKGTIANDKITFPTGQFLKNKYTFNIYQFCGVNVNDAYKVESFAGDVVFDYDADTKTLTSNDSFVVNSGFATLYPIEIFVKPSISYSSSDEIGNPADPTILKILDYTAINRFGWVKFDLPNYDVNGNFLDKDRMFYNFYVNGEMFLFTNEDYKLITEPTYEVPYALHNATGPFWVSDTTHYLYFFFEDADSYGIRSIYVKEDGEKLYSNIVTWVVNGGDEPGGDEPGGDEPGEDSVKELDGNQVESVEFYDFNGRRVNNPEHGVYLKVSKLSNGKKVTSKEVVK